jgi:hypothetical protein
MSPEERINIGKRGRVHLDKRSDSRVFDKVRIHINVILDRGFKTAHQAAREVTIDISEGGLRFHDDWGLPDNALLEIELSPEDSGEKIIHYGEVRWKTPAADRPGFEIGVQFTEATRAHRDAWLAYVQNRRNLTSTARLILKFNDETKKG